MAFEAVVGWLLPKISRLKAEMKDTLDYYFSIRAFSVGFSLLSIYGLFLLSNPVFTLWLGAEKYAQMEEFMQLFLLFEAFLIMTIMPKYYLNAIRSLKFVTFIELIYKVAMIFGMVLFFYISRTAESLIWGQILALMLFLPLSYYLVNRKELHANPWKESLLAFIPSFCLLGPILIDSKVATLIFPVIAFFSYFLIFIRDKRFKHQIITE